MNIKLELGGRSAFGAIPRVSWQQRFRLQRTVSSLLQEFPTQIREHGEGQNILIRFREIADL